MICLCFHQTQNFAIYFRSFLAFSLLLTYSAHSRQPKHAATKPHSHFPFVTICHGILLCQECSRHFRQRVLPWILLARNVGRKLAINIRRYDKFVFSPAEKVIVTPLKCRDGALLRWPSNFSFYCCHVRFFDAKHDASVNTQLKLKSV